MQDQEAFRAGSSFGFVASRLCDCRQARELTSFPIDQTGAELRGLGSHFQSKILNLFATYMNLKFIAKEWFSLKYKSTKSSKADGFNRAETHYSPAK